MIATARAVESMEGLRTLPAVQLMQLDVCKSDSIKAAVAGVLKTAGRIDILVRASMCLSSGLTACTMLNRRPAAGPWVGHCTQHAWTCAFLD